ncbi:MAG: nidogen-like domain-containing protein [Acidimicrobiales bacterium]
MFEGRRAFCVYWEDVGYFGGHTDKLNTFRLYLVDAGGGDFEIVFDYDSILWETGDASGGSNGFGGTSAGAGFSSGNGDPSGFFELPGSLTNGAFLDGAPTGLARTSSNSFDVGVHRFAVRNGSGSGTLQLNGRVVGGASGGSPVAGALVEVCPSTGGRCPFVTFTDDSGRFFASGLSAGDDDVRGFPPTNSPLAPRRVSNVAVSSGPVPDVEVVLPGTGPPAAGTTIVPSRTDDQGVPSVRPGEPAHPHHVRVRRWDGDL